MLASAMAGSVASAAPARSVTAQSTTFETQILDALNEARLDPQTYGHALLAYRKRFKGKIVTMPGTSVTYRTVEGTAPVAEAMEFLADEESNPALRPANVLAAAAADHVAAQSRSGRTGHFGIGGDDPASRVVRRGGGRMVAEVIVYGAFDASDVVRQLIVDDGVPDRGHRSILFQSGIRYAGVACGYHPRFRTMCVIDLAETPDGSSQRDPARMQIASIGG